MAPDRPPRPAERPETSHSGTKSATRRAGGGLAYAGAAWAFAFAFVNLYLAAGGTIGLETLGVEFERDARAREPALVWGGGYAVGAAKLVAGLAALALARGWGSQRLRRLIARVAVVGGALAALYGLASAIQHGLMEAGAVDTPEKLGSTAVTWHLALWDPVWLVGGLLFAAAGVAALRSRGLRSAAA